MANIGDNTTSIGDNASAITALNMTVGDNQTNITDLQDRVVVDQGTYVNSSPYNVEASIWDTDEKLFSVDVAANETFDINAYVSDFPDIMGPEGLEWILKKTDS